MSQPTLDVIAPATAEVIATVPAATAADVDAAVRRAATAQRSWAAAAPADRARLLRRFAAVVDEHVEELAQLEVREAGHTVGNARWEAGNVRDLLDYAAGGAERLLGRQIPVAGGIDFTILEPLGVVGVIAPWNFPMPIAAWGLAPALAAGNAVLLKPAETTPLTALRLAELALASGLPEGLFQVLPGEGPVAGSALVEHPGVAKIVFTGSTRTGKHIMARCAERVKRVTLELGGKSPNIVFADADVEAAAAAAPMSFLDNAGQDCCARTRILVERSVYDRFLDLLVPALSAVVVGDPADEKTQMGPLTLGGPAGSGCAHSSTAAGRPTAYGRSWVRRRRAPGSGTRRPSSPGSPRRAGGRGGGLRAGRGGPAVRGRGRTRCISPTPPTTGSPAPSGPGTWAARCA
ncbi:NAD/NADP-dependent betaine aldehyde dehydrogenase [Streptomyces californicus]